MNKILISILIILGIAGVAWATINFTNNSSNQLATTNNMQNTPHTDYNTAVSSELPDKCQTPPAYTEEDWREHMSHHPDRYKECFTNQQAPTPTYKNINSSDLKAMLNNKDFTLIDVHIPEQAHIPGTDSFIPFNEIDSPQYKLPQDKQAKIVLYCRSGNMSQTAAKTLLKMGYTNVYNLAGGVNDWKKNGYPVEDISL